MRNILRADKGEKLEEAETARRHWAASSLAVSLCMLVASLFVAQYVHAIQECTTANNSQVLAGGGIGGVDPTNGNPVGGFPFGSTAQWTNGNFGFRVYDLYTHKGPGNPFGATSGGTCSVSFHIDPAISEFQMNGTRPVDVRLGVPNMGANNNDGVWAPGQSVGNGTPVDQPPQFDNNFHSWAGFADDAGMATIAGSFANTSFQTLWCNKFVPGAINAGGAAGGGLLAGDASVGCPNDIVQFNGQNGTGFMFTTDNCHFGDAAHGISNTDSNGFGPLNCANYPGNTQNALNSWYWGPLAAMSGASPVTGGPVTPKDALSLRNHIGCNGGGPCDGRSLPIDGFNVHEYARNHTYTDTTNEAFAASAHTILTFAYPIPAKLAVNLTPANCYTLPGHLVANDSFTTGCAVDSKGSFLVSVTKQNVGAWGVAGTLASGKVTVTLPPAAAGKVTYSGVNASCAAQNIDASQAANGTLTWDFDASQLALLNLGGNLVLCFNVTTLSPQASSLVQYNPSATSSGTIESTGMAVVPDTSSNAEYITSPQFPYLTTTGGDVNAGGQASTTCTASPPATNPAHSITGQSGAIPGSKGDYVVSAGGPISNFPSGTPNPLGLVNYYGICRPDLVVAAIKAYTTGSMPTTVFVADGQLVTPGNSGELFYSPSAATVTIANAPLDVKGRVTLYAGGDVVIKNDITESPQPNQPLNSLASFGIVAAGNIYIDKNVHNIQAFLYSKQRIFTCTNGAAPYDTDYFSAATLPGALLANCNQPLNLLGLMSANSFVFNRTGGAGAKGPVQTETFNYTGLILLAPPPLFDAISSNGGNAQSIQILPPQY